MGTTAAGTSEATFELTPYVRLPHFDTTFQYPVPVGVWFLQNQTGRNPPPVRSDLRSAMTRPSTFEDFLYLLSELERVVDRRDVRFPSDQADIIRNRLARIAARVSEAEHVMRRPPMS